MRSPATSTVSAAAAAIAAATALAQPATTPAAHADEPRAYGYTVGDVVRRRVQLQLPDGLALDPSSLPPVRRPGQALELRSARLAGRELQLDYQVMRSPPAVRILEMPPLQLRFTAPGGGAAQTLRVDAWPVTVAPLTPPEPSPRTGLGEMRPDLAPPPIDTTARRLRLAFYGAALLLVGGWFVHVHAGIGRRRRRPFGDAWRALRRLPPAPTPEQRRQALRALHTALNRSAGAVLFESDVAAFVARERRYAALLQPLQQFFRHSQAEFFGAGGSGDADIGWLQRLARDCRDAERGTS